MKLPVFLFLLVSLFLVTTISALPPQTNINPTLGITVEHPISDTLKVLQPHKFHFHIFNSTDGRPFLNSSDVKCLFHLYNQSGSHLTKINPVASDVYDWEAVIGGGNFSTPGQYAYVFQCNNSVIGGFYEHDFMVTTTGTIQYSIFDNPLILLLGLLGFALIIFGAVKGIPWLGFIGSILFLLLGIYVMIYGLNNVTDLYTRGIALVFVGIGFILMFLSAYEWVLDIGDEGDSGGSYEED